MPRQGKVEQTDCKEAEESQKSVKPEADTIADGDNGREEIEEDQGDDYERRLKREQMQAARYKYHRLLSKLWMTGQHSDATVKVRRRCKVESTSSLSGVFHVEDNYNGKGNYAQEMATIGLQIATC